MPPAQTSRSTAVCTWADGWAGQSGPSVVKTPACMACARGFFALLLHWLWFAVLSLPSAAWRGHNERTIKSALEPVPEFFTFAGV